MKPDACGRHRRAASLTQPGGLRIPAIYGNTPHLLARRLPMQVVVPGYRPVFSRMPEQGIPLRLFMPPSWPARPRSQTPEGRSRRPLQCADENARPPHLPFCRCGNDVACGAMAPLALLPLGEKVGEAGMRGPLPHAPSSRLSTRSTAGSPSSAFHPRPHPTHRHPRARPGDPTGPTPCWVAGSGPAMTNEGEGAWARRRRGRSISRNGRAAVTECFTACPLQTQLFHGAFPRFIPTLRASAIFPLPSPDRGSPTKWRRRRRGWGGRTPPGSALGSPWVK